MNFLGKLILALLVSLCIYIYYGYSQGFGKINSEIYKFSCEYPILTLLSVYCFAVSMIDDENENKITVWGCLPSYIGIIMIITAAILYYYEVHGYNKKLLVYGIGLCSSTVIIAIFNGGGGNMDSKSKKGKRIKYRRSQPSESDPEEDQA